MYLIQIAEKYDTENRLAWDMVFRGKSIFCNPYATLAEAKVALHDFIERDIRKPVNAVVEGNNGYFSFQYGDTADDTTTMVFSIVQITHCV